MGISKHVDRDFSQLLFNLLNCRKNRIFVTAPSTRLKTIRMIKALFGKKDQDDQPSDQTSDMASSISISDFKDALSRYPTVLKAQHANRKSLILSCHSPKKKLTQLSAKPDSTPIEELDKFRYVDAPVRFSKKTGNTMTLEDVQKLVEWKL